MRILKKSICLLLTFAMLFWIAGCGSSNADSKVVNLSENIQPVKVKQQKLSNDFISTQQDFALEVFATESKKHTGNLNISSYSLSFALSIVAGGAQGNTLSQFEAVLMNSMNSKEWNKNMYSYLQKNKNYLSQADSLWISKYEKDVKQGFLQNTLGNFDACVYSINFGNKNAVHQVNSWVSEKTKGKINSIVDKFDANTAMYVADAVYINTPWETTHRADDVKEEVFTCANGNESTVKMMYSNLSENQPSYIKDENAEGFIKSCQGDYKFIALMPSLEIDINDYIASLDGNRLRNILSSGEKVKLKTGMPYFTIESSINFKETLIEMGIKDAYDAYNADFTGILDDNTLYLGETSQKTYINVDIGGIHAASATGQEIIYKSPISTEEKAVVLNRPFVYIIANEYNIPIFIGVVTTL